MKFHRLRSTSFTIKITNWVLFVPVLIGAMYHLSSLSIDYFEYDVTIESHIINNLNYSSKTVNFCFFWHQILNISAFGGDEFKLFKQRFRREKNRWTVGELLFYTNDFEKLLHCSGRPIESFIVIGVTPVRCFQVTNFDSCYIKANNETMNIQKYIYSLSEPIPTLNHFFVDFEGYYNGTSLSVTNLIRGHHYKFHRLPSPHKDHCMKYTKFRNRKIQECYRNMTKGSLMRLTIAPANDDQYSNLSWGKQNEIVKDMCEKKYWKDDCEAKYIYYTTKKMWTNSRSRNGYTDYQIGKDAEPSTQLTSTIKINFRNYLLQVMSVLGTWFGLSVMGLNPIRIVMKGKKEKVTEPRFRTDRETKQTVMAIWREFQTMRYKYRYCNCKCCR